MWWCAVALAEPEPAPAPSPSAETGVPLETPVDPGPPTPEAAVAEALESLQRGDVEGALARFTEATVRWPEAAEPWRFRSAWELATGRFDALATTLATAPEAHREALRTNRALAAFAGRAMGLPPDHPLRALDLEAELAAFDARGGADAEFATVIRLTVLLASTATDPSNKSELRRSAVQAIVRPESSPQLRETACAALAGIEAFDEAIDALERVDDDPGRDWLVARLQLLKGLQAEDARTLKRAARGFARAAPLPGLSEGAVDAERYVAALVLEPWPEGDAATATEVAIRERLSHLDASVPTELPWVSALSVTLASLTAVSQPSAALEALQRLDLERGDPVVGVVAALALSAHGDVARAEAMSGLSGSDDEDTRRLASAWLAAGDAAPKGWTAVATGSAEVGVGVTTEGPKLDVRLIPTAVMVPLPE